MRSTYRGAALIALALAFWAGFGCGLWLAHWSLGCGQPSCPCAPCDCSPTVPCLADR